MIEVDRRGGDIDNIGIAPSMHEIDWCGEFQANATTEIQLSQPIEELNLETRALNALDGIETIGELLTYTGSELRRHRNFGFVFLKRLRERLASRGLFLKGDNK
jgi:DNA-directed RNA polymerase alpha subunit